MKKGQSKRLMPDFNKPGASVMHIHRGPSAPFFFGREGAIKVRGYTCNRNFFMYLVCLASSCALFCCFSRCHFEVTHHRRSPQSRPYRDQLLARSKTVDEADGHQHHLGCSRVFVTLSADTLSASTSSPWGFRSPNGKRSPFLF